MSAAPGAPRVSVVIPARNEAACLGACLDSVLQAVAAVGGGEVLVIDGESTDATPRIAAEYASRHPSVRLLRNRRRITPAAFNLGIAEAAADRIAIVSAHSRVAPDFLAAALARLDRGEADIVGGPVTTEPGGEGTLAWLLAQIVSHPFGVGNSRFRISGTAGYVDAVPFAVFTREVFQRVGVFELALPRNQDTEFFGRVARAGARVFLDPAVRSVYRARGTLGGLLRQGFGNAYWNVLVWRMTPRAFQPRHLVPGVFALAVYASLGILALMGQWLPAAAVLGPYAVGATAASGHIALTRRRWAALALPPLFLLYHVVYGTGTLAGLRLLARRLR